MEKQQQSKGNKRSKNDGVLSRSQVLQKRAEDMKTPSDLGDEAIREITEAVNILLADTFVLYFKTKNFHWHICGPHFRDYHLMLDEQAAQIFAMTDEMAERVRKIGGSTLKSLEDVGDLCRLSENSSEFVSSTEMLRELCDDNRAFISYLREVRELCSRHEDAGTASMTEVWIDETERRTWFLHESTREMHS